MSEHEKLEAIERVRLSNGNFKILSDYILMSLVNTIISGFRTRLFADGKYDHDLLNEICYQIGYCGNEFRDI